VFGQQTEQGGTAMSFYEKGPVRIQYEEAGSGFPLLLVPGGGLSSTIAGLKRGRPFNAIEEFKREYRCIFSDMRNANGGQSSGPLEIDRPWDAYTDDHIAVMDHLGIDKFMVMGFCIGGPLVWNLLKRAPDRIVAAVLAQPSGFRPELPNHSYENNQGLGPRAGQAPARHHDGDGRHISNQDVPHQPRLRLDRDTRFRAQLPDARTDPAG
jgi:pimeloyl-ACP methyl ester carboxylesterase